VGDGRTESGIAVVGHRVTSLSLTDPRRFDAHLLPGDSSIDLFRRLVVHFVEIHDDQDPVPVEMSPEDATTAPDGGGDAPVRLRFTAGFAGSDADPNHALGITFDPDLGIVTADNPLPPGTRMQNLLVKAIATARNGEQRTRAELWIRAHLHERVERIWLTPNPLTLRESASHNPRLTLLAEFDDGVVADTTRITDRVRRGTVACRGSPTASPSRLSTTGR
jgi:hypothetical protein